MHYSMVFFSDNIVTTHHICVKFQRLRDHFLGKGTVKRCTYPILPVFSAMSNLTCVDNHLVDVATCMKWTTTSAIKHFNELHNPDMRSISAEIQLKAFIYACV